MADFHYSADDEGIATITWDVEDARMNVMSQNGISELERHFDEALADERVIGIVITSGKKDFAAGMDLNLLAGMKEGGGGDPARGIFEQIMRFHRLLRKIERAGMDHATLQGGKPVAAALPGTALGLGYEIPLACHRIFAADSATARIGLPEIRVGLFPGAGGTTRLVRRLGLMASAPFLLRGKTLAPKDALAANLVDEAVESGELLSKAREWVKSASDGDLAKPWDRKGYRMPGGRPYDRDGYAVFTGAAAMVNSETHGVYPAAKALLSAAYEGAQVSFDTALKIEARWFTHLLMQPSPSAMIRTLFVNKRALEKGARRPVGFERRKVVKLGVVGAGMMGAGIALVSARAGIETTLIDQDIGRAESGKSNAEKILASDVKRRRLSAEEKDVCLAKIRPAAEYSELADCDLVIEAVFEEPRLKADVIRRIEESAGSDCVIATNTSTLPVSGLAKAAANPDRFIGIHFFSPVHKMVLVEIIKGRETSDSAVALALDYTAAIRKTPIVVNDARFFYANRCIIPYLNEGIRMIGEGVEPALIENSAKRLGMPVGPLQLIDETSIELAASIAKASKAAMGEAYPDDDVDKVIFDMFEKGRLGRKAGAGFYEYDGSGRRTKLWRNPDRQAAGSRQQSDAVEVGSRLLMTQVLEAVRALEEDVLSDPKEGDVGAVLGWGFAPWSGGPFSWLDTSGHRNALRICRELEARYGSRFSAPELLVRHAEEGTSFY